MSELPELRAAVRVSAERRYGRRARRSRRLKLALPLVAAVVAATVYVVGRDTTRPTGEVAATATPTISTTPAPGTDTRATALSALASVYGAFRRPGRPSDRHRSLSRFLDSLAPQQTIEPDVANARRLATEGENAVYAVPTLENGHAGLCTMTVRRSRPAGMGCGPFDPAEAATRPRWGKTFYRPASLYYLLLPDGTETVEIHLKSGRVVTKRVQDNAIIIQIKGLKRMTWRDADGTERSTRAGI
jgi:hypothetical protein